MQKYELVHKVSLKVLQQFLFEIDYLFSPNVSSRVNLSDFARKLHKHAEIYGYADNKGKILAAFLVYRNDQITKAAYIPIFGVIKEYYESAMVESLRGIMEDDLRSKSFISVGVQSYEKDRYLADWLRSGYFIETTIVNRPNNGISIRLKKNLVGSTVRT